MKAKLWLFSSKDRKAFIIVRSPYRNSAKKRVKFVADGQGLLNWEFGKLSDEDGQKLLAQYQTDTLYEDGPV